MNYRREQAKKVRYAAADMAYNRPHQRHVNNGDENKYRVTERMADGTFVKDLGPSLINSFTKGLEHGENGIVKNAEDFAAFIRAADSGDLELIRNLPLNENVAWLSPVAQNANGEGRPATIRAWESMASGLTHDLQGPDAQAVCIPPAPALESDELVSELAEIYWMALCRDIRFDQFSGNATIQAAIAHLNQLPWLANPAESGLHAYEQNRKRGYFAGGGPIAFDGNTIFRGNIKGDDIGFHISQFLYVGNKALGNEPNSFSEAQGLIRFGSCINDQRVRIASPGVDYMTTWEHWLDVQNGADLRGLEKYVPVENDNNIDREVGYRFIITPRDLATYVHYDALHQAYFNACLILLNNGIPFDPGVPFRNVDSIDAQTGFATFGGPHILNLVSEVATRALKAVRYQKFNVHRRARPEQIAGWVHRFKSGQGMDLEPFEKINAKLGADLLNRVRQHNAAQNPEGSPDSWLLPMPFVEGSPMHPSYGSGHATVAGACVTILKAFFDEGSILPFAYVPSPQGRNLIPDAANLGRYTVEGELNKLAANIAFGRNWAGVHWYSDQLESLRLGEQIALGILEEQKLQYGENFSMNVPLFDGTTIRI
ncbi:vanadium-dependent haloperoxidase [Arundinibacter roseus]|uniref:Bromoperoxidase n=1 Tax=Arundinibacter roseus TaxID=2070510 RepID=A0A4R4KAP9_9BACT|nr:vanadium-dependent haloperoxidase [Arundinibacter roseus]TDB63782.1 bromoperoxidase [Arundinibacter roseus]